MDKIKTVKIKNLDGSVSEESYIISVDSINVDMENGRDLQDTIGNINIDEDGNIAEQLNKKIDKIYIEDNLNSTNIDKALSANQGRVLNNKMNEKPYYFNNVTEMKSANLKDGDMAITLGYYSVNDGGGAEYKIIDTVENTKHQEELINGFYATLIINNEINPIEIGAKCNGINDDAIYIRKAINILSKNGGGILNFLEGKTYNLQSLDGNSFIWLKNNCNIKGCSTLRVSNNFGDYKSIFNYNENIENLTIEDIIIEHNTINNPSTENTGYNSECYRTDFYFANNSNYINNLIIKNIIINDCVGKWQFTSNTNKNNILIDNVTINFNSTEEAPTYDRTSIYIGANKAIVQNCKLNGNNNAYTAIELHGNNNIAINNMISLYAAGILMVNENTAKRYNIISESQHASNNQIVTWKQGIIIWNTEGQESHNLKNIHINNNYIRIYNNNYLGGAALGMQDAVTEGAVIDSVNIENNTIIGDGNPIRFIRINCPAPNIMNSCIKNMNIVNNHFSGDCIESLCFQFVTPNTGHFYIENLNFNNNIINITRIENIDIVFQLYLNESMKTLNILNNIIKINCQYTTLFVCNGGVNNNAKIYIKNNIVNGEVDIAHFFRCETDIFPIIEHTFDKIILSDVNVQNLLNYSRTKIGNGSILKDSNITIKKLEDVFILNYIGKNMPKHIPVYKSSQFQLLDDTNALKIATSQGFLPDHDIGTNKIGDWVLYNNKVYQSLTNNSLTEASNDWVNFRLIGNYPSFNNII